MTLLIVALLIVALLVVTFCICSKLPFSSCFPQDTLASWVFCEVWQPCAFCAPCTSPSFSGRLLVVFVLMYIKKGDMSKVCVATETHM